MQFKSRVTPNLGDDRRPGDAGDRGRETWTTDVPDRTRSRAELRLASARRPGEVAPDVITMGSRFELSGQRPGEPVYYMLVHPEDDAPRQGLISALSPMGAALLGARVGDEVRWLAADGPRLAKVVRLLYQPESAGHHSL